MVDLHCHLLPGLNDLRGNNDDVGFGLGPDKVRCRHHFR
jgi:hypothetical protein